MKHIFRFSRSLKSPVLNFKLFEHLQQFWHGQFWHKRLLIEHRIESYCGLKPDEKYLYKNTNLLNISIYSAITGPFFHH